MLFPSIYLTTASPERPVRARRRAAAVAGDPRKGAVLLIVLVMLTIFAVMGLAFMFYADSESVSAATFRDAQAVPAPDVDPEVAFAHFLAQLLYDCKDDGSGVFSALRGHSMFRTMYGLNYTGAPGSPTFVGNNQPFNGTGRLRFAYNAGNSTALLAGADEYNLVNYTYFPSDGFVRDPERLGVRAFGGSPNAYGYGANAPYTAADNNTLFLAAVKNDGTILMPSFHRNYNGIALDPSSATYKWWFSDDPTRPWLKYTTLRPRPSDHPAIGGKPGFPAPEDAGGDVRNRPNAWGPPGNDSVWLYTGAPVFKLPDGRMYTMCFAPLVVDLNSKLDLNSHGNIAGVDSAGLAIHAANQGWGPTEIKLAQILGDIDMRNLCLGLPNSGTPRILGKYGANRTPATATTTTGGVTSASTTQTIAFNPSTTFAGAAVRPHFYSKVDFDGMQNTRAASLQWTLPGTAYRMWPTYPGASFTNANTGAGGERTLHPLLYNPVTSNTTPVISHRVFTPAELEMLYRYGDKNSEAMQSDLFQLLPNTFQAQNKLHALTTLSFDRTVPGMLPYLPDLSASPANRFQVALDPLTGKVVTTAPTMVAPTFPTPGNLGTAGGEFGSDGRGLPPLGAKLDLNRKLPPYPTVDASHAYPVIGATGTFDTATFIAAQQARQKFAQDIYTVLRKVTGAYDPFSYNKTTPTPAPTLAEFNGLRFLAQLAVNMVDYIDDDDVITPFNWGQIGSADFQADYGTNWVFGTEVPKLVINEAYAEYKNDPADTSITMPPKGIPAKASHYFVDVYAELYNPMLAGDTAPPERDSGNARLYVVPTGAPSGYSVYQLLLTRNNTFIHNPENTAGLPDYTLPADPTKNPPVPGTPSGAPKVGPPPQIRGVVGAPGTTDWGLPTTGGAGDTTVVLPLGGNFAAPTNQGSNVGFYMVGPADSAGLPIPFPSDPAVADPMGKQIPPKATINAKGMRYVANVVATNPTAAPGAPTLILQRLLCPYAPPNSDPTSPLYNPYITVDYFASITQNKAADTDGAGNKTPVTPFPARFSVGRFQPYQGGLPTAGKVLKQNVVFPTSTDPTKDQSAASLTPNQPMHTFFHHNAADPATSSTPGVNPPNTSYGGAAYWPCLLTNPPASPNAAPAPATTLATNMAQFKYIVQLDRPLISPAEVLNVSACSPHLLIQNFDGTAFGHQAPWLTNFLRLYRFFEFVETHARQTGAFTNNGATPTSLPRVPGKVNINTIWDLETFLALCDPENGNHFTAADVSAIWTQLLALRSPGGAPGPNERPFLPFSAGYTVAGGAGTQYPTNGLGIEDTILRPFAVPSPLPTPNPPADPGAANRRRLFEKLGAGPYFKDELMNKLFNNLTVRSHCFAVWVTVGFFEVNQVDPSGRVYLGQEIGRAENRHIRHRMFAVIDRSQWQNVLSTTSSTPVSAFGPASITVTLPATGSTLTGNTWSVPASGFQAGQTIRISGVGTTEEVLITAATPPSGGTQTLTGDFKQTHVPATGATYTVQLMGNPGPAVTFNPHSSTYAPVLAHFSIME